MRERGGGGTRSLVESASSKNAPNMTFFFIYFALRDNMYIPKHFEIPYS